MSGPTSQMSKSPKGVDERQEGSIGQGELYSPDHAIKLNTNNNNNNVHVQENTMVRGGVGVGDIRNMMGTVRDRLMEKLRDASVPSDRIDNARHFLETVVRDVTSAAQGITKEALQRIKSHLADILPSLSPSQTSKMVDDAEKEAASGVKGQDKDEEMERSNEEHHQKGRVHASATSSPSSSYLAKPASKL